MFRCIIAIDNPGHAGAVKQRLQKLGYPVDIAALAADGNDLASALKTTGTDLLIFQSNLKHLPPLPDLKELLQPLHGCAVIVASRQADFNYDVVSDAMEIGAKGYILLPLQDEYFDRAVGTAVDWLQARENRSTAPRADSTASDKDACPAYRSKDMAEKVYQLIVDNHVHAITMADIINTLHISESYVNKLLMKYKNSSFKKILNNSRINHAKNLLLEESEMSMAEIAEKVGYTDAQYFCRLYKAYTGVSPAAYRKAKKSHNQE